MKKLKELFSSKKVSHIPSTLDMTNIKKLSISKKGGEYYTDEDRCHKECFNIEISRFVRCNSIACYSVGYIMMCKHHARDESLSYLLEENK